MKGKGHFINNEWEQGTGPEFQSTDPATGEVNWVGRAGTEEEVNRAVRAAAGAFEIWSGIPVEDRVKHLEAFEEKLTAAKNDFAETICRETGKPRWEALTETASMIAKIRISIEAYYERCAPGIGELSGASTATRFKPHGVVAVFGPFNLPGHLPNGHIVPALLAGNTVVYKPSEHTPLVAEKTLELWLAAGLPAGAMSMVQGDRDTGGAVASNPGIDGLFFTGSSQAGKWLHKAFAGRPEKILALEMGGNNPLVVHEVSDWQAAAYMVVESAFITAGQRCTCARRLIVPRGIEGSAFVDRLVSMIHKIRVGRYTDVPEPFMGPVISKQAADDLLTAKDRLSARGGKSIVRIKRLPGSTAMLCPGLMDVSEMRNRPDEEIFGPFLQLIRVPDFDAAIVEADNTAFGLSAGLISDNEELYRKFFRSVKAGVINWNRPLTGASGRMPFGGVGESGNHRPAGYFSTDYCSYPVASIEANRLTRPKKLAPGIDLSDIRWDDEITLPPVLP